MRLILFPILLIALIQSDAQCHLELNPIFGSGMVIQRDRPAPIWGNAPAGSIVQVSLNGKHAQAEAGPDGKWVATLPSVSAGGPHKLLVRNESRSIELNDVLIGDVWLCSGQSNMAWPLSKTLNGQASIEQAHNTQLRLLQVSRKAADTPQDAIAGGSWRTSTPINVANFSAVAFHFGQYLQAELDIPIGLIHSSVGGTLANNWTRETVLRKNPDAEPYFARYERELREYPEKLAAYEEAIKNDPTAKPPMKPEKRQPAGYYNGMIAPLQPFAIKGTIWYQGESDSWKYQYYSRFFRDLIQSWRSEWQQGDFPFLFVQLAAFDGKPGVSTNYPELREIQRQTLALPNTAMAVTIDVGEIDDIHPQNKKPVGERLALAALGKVYQRDIVHSGPLFSDANNSDQSIVLQFNHTGSGLTSLDGPLRGFEVSGPDNVFREVEAFIENNQVCIPLTDPLIVTAVRYSWDGFPDGNLYNEEGLPASPFRIRLSSSQSIQ